MRFSIFPFLLLVLPAAEIAVFIVVGQQIGVIPTLALILLTAIAGSVLLRVQGLGLLARIAEVTARGKVPGRELVHGVMILVAAVLLITPGFITDTLGLLLFIPPVRDLGWKLLKDRIVVVSRSRFGNRRHRGDSGDAPERGAPPVIDLEAGEFERNRERPSPWARKKGDE